MNGGQREMFRLFPKRANIRYAIECRARCAMGYFLPRRSTSRRSSKPPRAAPNAAGRHGRDDFSVRNAVSKISMPILAFAESQWQALEVKSASRHWNKSPLSRVFVDA